MKIKKSVRAAFGLVMTLIISFAFSPSQASASTCVPDWNANIFDDGFVGTSVVKTGSTAMLTYQAMIAIAPTFTQDYKNKISDLGKDVHVTTRYLLNNALPWDNWITTASDNPYQAPLRASLYSDIYYKRYSDGYFPPFSFIPGTQIRTQATVLTPGCDARVFTSNAVEVPTTPLPDWSSPEIQNVLKAGASDFTAIDALNNYVSALNGTTFTLDKDAVWTPPKYDTPILNPIPDWRSCSGVTLAPYDPTTTAVRLRIKDVSKTFDCQVPMYGYAGKIFTLASVKFHYSAPAPIAANSTQNASTSKASVGNVTNWICTKGKASKSYKGTTPKCPAGYKLK